MNPALRWAVNFLWIQGLCSPGEGQLRPCRGEACRVEGLTPLSPLPSWAFPSRVLPRPFVLAAQFVKCPVRYGPEFIYFNTGAPGVPGANK